MGTWTLSKRERHEKVLSISNAVHFRNMIWTAIWMGHEPSGEAIAGVQLEK